MRIVDPTHAVPAVAAPAAPTAPGAAAAGLCLFSNSKPGARELLAGLAQRLAERGVHEVGFAAKPNAAVAADAATLDHLAARYRAAVVAIAD